MDTNLDKLPSLHILELNKIYDLIGEVRADEIHAAKGIKVAHTRVRVKLAKIADLCKSVREAILARMKTQKEGKNVEKYGVDEKGDDAREKTATKTKPTVCPKCGDTPERHGKVLLCPKCGSEPFEPK